MDLLRLGFDIETDGLLEELTTIHSLCIKNLDTGETFSCHDHGANLNIEDGLAILASADEVVGHNIQCFDIPAIQQVYPDWRLKDGCKITDTLTLSYLIYTNLEDLDFAWIRRNPSFPKNKIGSHSLKAWGYRLGILKGTFGEDTDWKFWSADMQRYCEQDVLVTVKLWQTITSKNYSPEAVELEHRFREIIFWQESLGFKFDERAAITLHAELREEKRRIEDQLCEVFPSHFQELKTRQWYEAKRCGDSIKESTKGAVTKAARSRGWKPSEYELIPGPPKIKEHRFNPGSRDQIVDRLVKKYGWQPSKMTDSGKPAVDEEVLAMLPYEEAPLLLRYLMIDKRIGQIAEGNKSWLNLVKRGRIHGRVQTNGAVTGRCTHSNPNVTQVPSCKVEYGKECRSLFVADDDYMLVGCDADGLELRCLAHFMSVFDGGEYAKVVDEGDKSKGTDVHSTNSRAIGLDPTKMYPSCGKLETGRDIAKTYVYAYIYGSGDHNLALTVYGPLSDEETNATLAEHRDLAVSMHKWMSKSWAKKGKTLTRMDLALAVRGNVLRTNFEKNLPALGKLIEAVKQTVKERGWLRGLDGRKLHVRKEHAALNTLLQSAGALIMKKALVIFVDEIVTEKKWAIAKHPSDLAQAMIGFVANVHDEAQKIARPEIAEEAGRLFAQSITRAGEHFNFQCPLAGAYGIGKSWADTH